MKGLKKENNDIQKNGSFFKQKIANQKKTWRAERKNKLLTKNKLSKMCAFEKNKRKKEKWSFQLNKKEKNGIKN